MGGSLDIPFKAGRRLAFWWRWLEEHPLPGMAIIVGLFSLLHLFIWGVVLEAFWYDNSTITDTDVYYEYASNIIHGELPYRDFAAEYPPVAMLFFLLPRLLSGSGYGNYVIAFEGEMWLVGCGIMALMAFIAWRQWHSLPRAVGVLAVYSFFILSLGTIVKARFDLTAALIILASLACFLTDRRFAAWLLLGVGVMTKVVPLLLAPLYLIILLRRRQLPELWMGPAVMALTALIIATPFLVASPGAFADAFLYHVQRPLQLESSWASPLLLLNHYRGYPVDILDTYGSHNVFSAATDLMTTLSGPVALALLAGAFVIFWRRCREDFDRFVSDYWLIRFAAAVLAIFIFSGKVFSPQFLIWLMPLVPLARGRDWPLVNGMFALALLLTQWEFPYRYWELYSLDPTLIMETASRNALVGLLALFLVLAPGWRRRKGSAGATLPPGSAR